MSKRVIAPTAPILPRTRSVRQVWLVVSFVIVVVSAGVTPPSSAASRAGRLQISGTIKPEACRPSLGAGGVADFDKRAMTGEVQTALGRRPAMEISLNIHCTAPTTVTLRVSDNRSALTGLPASKRRMDYSLRSNVANGGGNQRHGGAYEMHLPPTRVSIDGRPARQVIHHEGQRAWHAGDNDARFGNARSLGWSRSGSLAPAPFTHLKATLLVAPTLTRMGQQHKALDGSATFELRYL